MDFSRAFDGGEFIFNYVDTPDMKVRELVSLTREHCFGAKGLGFFMPARLGLIAGRAFDCLAWLLDRQLPISHVRIVKFLGTTKFKSSVIDTGFDPPFSLEDGLKRTLVKEFPK